jgi:hypothetical protein
VSYADFNRLGARFLMSNNTPYLRWHYKDGPAARRLRLRLEGLLGSRCHYCGVTREQGASLQFHHPLGRDWTPSKLSWKQRLYRYKKEISLGLLALACDDSGAGNNCHEKQRLTAKRRVREAVKLYDYDHDGLGTPDDPDSIVRPDEAAKLYDYPEPAESSQPTESNQPF